MADEFTSTSDTLTSPAQEADDVTPHDSNALSDVTKGVYVGTSGDLAVIMLGGQTCVFASVPAGTILPIRATHIKSTGTTASAIVAIW